MARSELLLNGKLGEPFYPFGDDASRVTAVSWQAWWIPAKDGTPGWKNRQPVFSDITLDSRLVQQLATPFGTHVGGLWQQVPSAPGNKYELMVEAQAWSSDDVAPGSQVEAGDVNMQVGIDPTGGLDPESPLIVWSQVHQPLSRWEMIHLAADAEADIITVYLKSAPSLPKRQQAVFWRNAFLRPVGRHKRSVNIVGIGDTHISIEPEYPYPGDPVTVSVSSTREHQRIGLLVRDPDGASPSVANLGKALDGERHVWRYEFKTAVDGLYEVRFVGDRGARMLSLRLLQVARNVQLVSSDASRLAYKRVYVLLPPTADVSWFTAAARGGFNGRFTIGFSADDAGIGDLGSKHVLAVNPHHWPEVLTAVWFKQHYPGAEFTPVVANKPEDLEAWLKDWLGSES